MTLSDLFSNSFSLLALVVSAITAYRTFYAKFKTEVFVKPRIILNRFNKIPSLVIGCELSNRGAHSGAIDDIVLRVKYRQHNSQQGTKSISTHLFLPALIKEEYNVFKTYQDTDFEPFQSISIAANSRLTRFIVFSPGSEDGFSPVAGEIELQLFSRNAGETKWNKSPTSLRVPIDDNSASSWRDPNGQGVLLEAFEHNQLRENLMEQVSN